MEKTIHRRTPFIKRANRNILKGQVLDRPRKPRTIRTSLFRYTQDSRPAIGTKCIVRLERNNKTLIRLRRRLDSYVYEPRTPELFDRIEYLKDQIETTRTKNSEIIGFLMYHRHSVGDYLDFIKYASNNFHTLKRKIEEYMCDAHDGRLVS